MNFERTTDEFRKNVIRSNDLSRPKPEKLTADASQKLSRHPTSQKKFVDIYKIRYPKLTQEMLGVDEHTGGKEGASGRLWDQRTKG
jgi:hypothetical protein